MKPKHLAIAAGLGLLALARKGSEMFYPPTPKASDWAGFVWPVPITDGRVPVISQEYRPGERKDRGVHLGVDIMFAKRAGDPPGLVFHDASKGFIAPAGTLVIAAGPGKIWSTAETGYGRSIQLDHGVVGDAGGVVSFYQHLSEFARLWRKGDIVRTGDVLGSMGYTVDPKLDSQRLRHLHFELWFPRATIAQSKWPQDPAPYMRFWKKVQLPGAVS